MPIRILIADDQPMIRRVLRALVEKHVGWQVCGEAENGFEAVRKATELKPDLIILDMAMPIMDGVRAAREISSAYPTLPILMHTMHSSPTLDLEAKKAGVSRVLGKGVSGDEIFAAIEELLILAQAGRGADAIPRVELAAESRIQQAEQPKESPSTNSEGKMPPEPD